MQRSSIIASVVAAGGVLIAGSAASVAVINAASSNPHQSEAVTVVAAAPSNSPSMIVEASESPGTDTDVAVESTPIPVATPTLIAADLPELPEVPDVTSTPRTVVPKAYVAPAPTPTRTTSRGESSSTSAQSNKPRKPARSASPSRTPSPSATAEEVEEIAGDQARDIVLQATGGGVVKHVDKTTRGEYSAWAVQVLRHDGSIVTGYVEATTGVIFDWVVDQAAPAPQQPTGTSGSGTSSGSGGEDDHHHDDSGEGDDD